MRSLCREGPGYCQEDEAQEIVARKLHLMPGIE